MTVDTLAILAPHAALTTGVVRFEGRDLTQRPMAVLYALYLHPGWHTVTTMAEQLGTLRTTATQITDRLAEQGLLHRDHDPTDRRVTLVLPTEAGAAYMQRPAALVEQANDALVRQAAV